MRLDRFLAKTLGESRTIVKKIIRSKEIFVNGEIAKSESQHINTVTDVVTFNDVVLEYEEFQYYLINKPAGYVCANEDNINPTIIEYAPEFITHKLHTVGRLDKDTTGTLLLTNNGKLTHQLISPKSGFPKVYFATLNHEVSPELIPIFKEGFMINDEFMTLPAELEIVSKNQTRVSVVEGKYHQIKRMFAHFGLKVTNLHRESFGPLNVDDLPIGEYRKLTKKEVALLIKD